MSEQQAEVQPQEGEQTNGAEQAEDAKTFDAEYVAKLRKEAAKYRSEAKANSEAAKRLAEIEESQKSESEKAADRIKTLEAEVVSARIDAFREAAVRFGAVTEEDAELFLTGSDVETLTKQIARLADRTDEQKKSGARVPAEGRAPNPAKGSKGEAFADFAEGFFTR